MRHLYIHIPFCARRCSYCDFAIAVRPSVPGREFVDGVLAERALRSGLEAGWNGPLDTLYLGGGTPSSLAAEQIEELVAGCNPAAGAEVTIEANPDDLSGAVADRWCAAGIKRVSLGAQSFHPRVLEWMHRTHDVASIERSVEALRTAAIESLSLDLIFGLPQELHYDFAYDLERALALEPDHLSMYGLSVEPRTPLARWVGGGRTTPGTDERYAAEFLLAHRTLSNAGYEHYEVSNYALGSARRSRHNSAYWSGVPYGGLGPSAHGFDGNDRRWNLAAWTAWAAAVGRGDDPIDDRETLTREQRSLEQVYLGLRTADGLDAREAAKLVPKAVLAAVDRGWLTQGPRRLRATPAGWLMLDGLVPALTTSAEGG